MNDERLPPEDARFIWALVAVAVLVLTVSAWAVAVTVWSR
jgi:hypothetical protein